MKDRSVHRTSRIVLLSMGIFLLPCIHAFADDVITLNSEEIIRGRIIDSTDTNISIEVANYNNTIFVTKVIAKSDIKTMERETAEEKKERADYAVISAYRLDPNQEFSEAQYTMGIAAFNKFLTDYPKSHFADDIKKRITDWSAELSNLQSGKEKFANQWITPDEKRIAADKWRKDKRVQDDLIAVQSLKHQLENLQIQRKQTADGLGTDQSKLGAATAQLANLQDQTTLQAVGTGNSGNGHWAHNPNGIAYWVPDRSSAQTIVPITTPNPERGRLSTSVGASQGQVAQDQMALSDLDNRIAATQSKLTIAENDYRVAEAEAQIVLAPTPTQIVKVATPPPSPPATPPPPPPPPPEQPWYVMYWKWIPGGVGLMAGLFVVSRSRGN